MLCRQLISVEIRPLSASDTIGTALQRMAELGVRQFPITEGERLQSLVWEDALLDLDAEALVGSLEGPNRSISVQGEEPFLTAVRVCQEAGLDVLPVLDSQDAYLGVITRQALFQPLARLCGASDQGALIVLGMAPLAYALSDINRIVESNDAVITHLNTLSDPEGAGLQVYLRLNRGDVASILASFRRYDYEVLYHPGEDWFQDELRLNLENLLTYLNV